MSYNFVRLRGVGQFGQPTSSCTTLTTDLLCSMLITSLFEGKIEAVISGHNFGIYISYTKSMSTNNEDDSISPYFLWLHPPKESQSVTGRIYKLYSHYTGHSYFGYTKQDPDKLRKLIQSQLRSGKHHNRALQDLAESYGWQAIIFEIIEGGAADLERYIRTTENCLNKRVVPPRAPRGGTPIRWEGIDYPSIAAASAATGLTPRQLRYRLAYQIESEDEMEPEPFTPPTVRCIFEEVEYPSIAAAARATGKNYGYVRRYARRLP